MKAITRNLFTYAAEIHASPEELESRLPQFERCGEHQRASWGFVNVIPDEDSDKLVLQVPGGWAICLREDSRTVPASEVKKLVNEKAAQVLAATGRKPGKKEIKELQADAIYDLLPRAFVRSKLTLVAYSARNQRLYVNSASQKVADKVVSALVEALKSVKFTTVHVSEPKMGLTTRLKNWLGDGEDADCFGSLHPVNEIVMAGAQSKWSVKISSLRGATSTLTEAMDRGATVDSMCFTDDEGVTFRVTSALRIKGVRHNTTEHEEDATVHHQWVSQLASELVTLDSIVDTLLDLLSPEKAQADTSSAATGDDEDLF